MDRTRASAVAALIVTGFAVIYAAGAAIVGWEPSMGWLIQTIIHLGELSAVLALLWCAVGGRVGLTIAVAGQLVIAAAEVIWPNNPDIANVLFSVSPLLTGGGLIAAGIAIIRAKAWTGPARLLPLALGAYTIVVLIPVMIGTGGPPSPLALWIIAGWDLLWCTLAAIVLTRVRSAVPSDPAAAKVKVM
jgi:hypothetical protein